MKKSPYLLLILLPLVACNNDESNASAPATVLDAAVDSAADAVANPGAVVDSAGDETAPDGSAGCAPQPNGKCSAGPGNTMCCPLNGDVYIWEPPRSCREKSHSVTDQTPYDCMNTATSADPQNACVGYPLVSCYERIRKDGRHEVMLSSYEYPASYLSGSAWTVCSSELCSLVEVAPDCE